MWRASSAPGSIEAASSVPCFSRIEAISCERHGAVANRTPHQTVAFRGELRDVVLEMNVPDPMGRPARERDRIFPDRERVAGIEADAGVRAEALGHRDQLFAAQILMVLDREDQPGIGDAAGLARQRVARVSEQLDATAHPAPRARPPARASGESAGSWRRHRCSTAPPVRASRRARVRARSCRLAEGRRAPGATPPSSESLSGVSHR